MTENRLDRAKRAIVPFAVFHLIFFETQTALAKAGGLGEAEKAKQRKRGRKGEAEKTIGDTVNDTVEDTVGHTAGGR